MDRMGGYLQLCPSRCFWKAILLHVGRSCFHSMRLFRDNWFVSSSEGSRHERNLRKKVLEEKTNKSEDDGEAVKKGNKTFLRSFWLSQLTVASTDFETIDETFTHKSIYNLLRFVCSHRAGHFLWFWPFHFLVHQICIFYLLSGRSHKVSALFLSFMVRLTFALLSSRNANETFPYGNFLSLKSFVCF